MSKAEEFRARAQECRELAGKSATAEMKEHYQELAYVWDLLANERTRFFEPKIPAASVATANG